MIFDLRQGSLPLSRPSAITTAALGLVAGGVAGLLFVTAQVTTLPDAGTGTLAAKQASRLVPFGVVIGFIAGLTLDAVFRKLMASDVVALDAVEAGRKG
jgi:membrane protease YdiL (CAAX protease family)